MENNIKKVKILVNMASKMWLPWQHVIPRRKIFPESCSPINFSESGHIWLVLLKYQGSSRKLKTARALSAPPPPKKSGIGLIKCSFRSLYSPCFRSFHPRLFLLRVARMGERLVCVWSNLPLLSLFSCLITLGSDVLHVRRNLLDVHGSSLSEYNLLRKTYLTTAVNVMSKLLFEIKKLQT